MPSFFLFGSSPGKLQKPDVFLSKKKNSKKLKSFYKPDDLNEAVWKWLSTCQGSVAVVVCCSCFPAAWTSSGYLTIQSKQKKAAALSAAIYSWGGIVPFFLWTNTNHLFMCVFILGIDFKIKTVELQGKKIKLQIWWVTGRTGCGVASPRMASFKGRFSWGYTQLSHFVTGLYFQLRWSSMRDPLNCF